MDYEKAVKRIEGMQDDVQRRIDCLPPLLRGRTSLWADLEALSIAKEAIYKAMEREKMTVPGERVIL